MLVHIESYMEISLHDLLVYATNLDQDDPSLDNCGVDPARTNAAKKIITDFYFNGDSTAAQKTIDYYTYLQTDAGKYADVPFD